MWKKILLVGAWIFAIVNVVSALFSRNWLGMIIWVGIIIAVTVWSRRKKHEVKVS